MLSVIRQFLLRGARELGLEYQGIRVNTEWEAPRMDRSRQGYFQRVVANRQVMIECDDEYIPESNQIRSLLPPHDNELARLATRSYMATDDPPPVIQPRVPRGDRQRARPEPQGGAGPSQEGEGSRQA